MKKLLLISLLAISVGVALPSISEAKALRESVKGRILLAVQANGEAWYVNPDNQEKYYLGRPDEALVLMQRLGLGVSNRDFDSFRGKAPAKLAGKIIIKVQDNGRAYYVDPVSLRLHYLGRPADAFLLMRNLGLGISDDDLRQIPTFDIRRQPFILVEYQGTQYGSISVKQVNAKAKGWIVIHRVENGKPGAVAGYAAVKEGENKNIVVNLTGIDKNQDLIAVLHVDAGRRDIFEYPGADVPVTVNGQTVMRKFFTSFESKADMVRIMNGFFSPVNLVVERGTTVTFINSDNITHSIISAGHFSSGEILKGKSYSRVFFDTGIYHYYTGANSSIKGTVTVR